MFLLDTFSKISNIYGIKTWNWDVINQNTEEPAVVVLF
jgi:hypothetical protein